MSLVVEVFTKWRDPVIKAQRKWFFSQMHGELAARPKALIFGVIVLGFLSLLLISGGHLLKPIPPLVFAMNLQMVGMGFAIFAVLPSCRQFRTGLAKVALLQAALLWLTLCLLLTGAISCLFADWTLVYIVLNIGLLGCVLALYMPSRFAKLHSREGAASYLMIASIGAAILLSQIGFSAWYFLLSICMLAAIVYKLRTWAQPAPAFISVKPAIEAQAIQLPIVSKWQVILQQFFGQKLDPKFWLKNVFSWGGACFIVVLGVQRFGFSATASDLYSSLLFGLVAAGTHALLSERYIWPYLWLRQIRSRKALWRHSELRFWAGQILLSVLLGLLILLADLDRLNNVLYAAALTMASFTLIRYANLAFPWFSWGKDKTDAGNSLLSYVLLIALWIVMRGLWNDGDYVLISWVSGALLLAALIIRRRAKQYILRFDLGALRRNQVL
jgi:hypothetical protein